MTNLSWFLYLIDVISNASSVLSFVTFACIMAGVVGLIFVLMHRAIEGSDLTLKYPIMFIVGGAIAALVAIPLPSKNTMYSIAAVEAGNMVISTPEAREIFDEVRNRILLELRGKSDTAKED